MSVLPCFAIRYVKEQNRKESKNLKTSMGNFCPPFLKMTFCAWDSCQSRQHTPNTSATVIKSHIFLFRHEQGARTALIRFHPTSARSNLSVCAWPLSPNSLTSSDLGFAVTVFLKKLTFGCWSTCHQNQRFGHGCCYLRAYFRYQPSRPCIHQPAASTRNDSTDHFHAPSTCRHHRAAHLPPLPRGWFTHVQLAPPDPDSSWG